MVDAGEADGLSIIVLHLFLARFDPQPILKLLIALASDNNWVRNTGIGTIFYPPFTGKETG